MGQGKTTYMSNVCCGLVCFMGVASGSISTATLLNTGPSGVVASETFAISSYRLSARAGEGMREAGRARRACVDYANTVNHKYDLVFMFPTIYDFRHRACVAVIQRLEPWVRRVSCVAISFSLK